MKKIVIIVLIVIVVLAVLGGFLFQYFMNKGYRPGDLSKRENMESMLIPPITSGGEHYWDVSEDISLYYDQKGEGKAVLVLHGGPGFPYENTWKGLDALTEKYSFYYYHQRGSGLSTRPIDRFESKNYYQNMQMLLDKLSIEQQIADVERIRRILDVEKIILIGHSFGGFIGSLYAMEFPESVEKLILVSPANMLKMPQDNEGDLFTSIEKNLKEDDVSQYQAFMKDYFNYGKIFEKSESDLTEMNNKIGYYYMKSLHNTGLIDSLPEVKPGYDNGWMTHAIYLSLGRQYDIRKDLSRIRAPVMIVHGEDDMIMDQNAIKTYSDFIEDISIETISGAGHNSFDDQPRIFSDLIDDFLEVE